MNGIVYLIQPREFVGTTNFKIGMSRSNTTRRINAYGSGTQVICTRECSNPKEVETDLISKFNKEFTLFRGREYFSGNKIDMIECFDKCIGETARNDNTLPIEVKHSQNSNYPSFDNIKAFIKCNPSSTICEIKKYFKQDGDDVCSNFRNGKKLVLAYSINSDFFCYLQKFIKQDYVSVDEDALACLVSDDTQYIGDGKFLPIVLTIRSN